MKLSNGTIQFWNPSNFYRSNTVRSRLVKPTTITTTKNNIMKKQLETIRAILENAQWTSECCHPDRFSNSEQAEQYVSNRKFGLNLIGECVSNMFEEILAEYQERNKDSFEEVAAEYIADTLARNKLSGSNISIPESATFRIVR